MKYFKNIYKSYIEYNVTLIYKTLDLFSSPVRIKNQFILVTGKGLWQEHLVTKMTKHLQGK